VTLLRTLALALAAEYARARPVDPEPLPAITQEAEQYGRCTCPTCRELDRLHPREGYQLALFPYRPSMIGSRR